jgi:hypothetical protein
VNLDQLWTYVPPTPEKQVKYDAIRAADLALQSRIEEARDSAPLTFVDIKDATLNLAKVIEDNAPPSADRTVAIRNCRLVRMLLNEWAPRAGVPAWSPERKAILLDRAMACSIEARMWACSAIALDGQA